MPALPLTGIQSGTYSAVWGNTPLALGQVAPGGFKLSYSHQAKMVYFDSLGTVPADSIMTGIAMTLDFICMEPNQTGLRNLAWPFNATRGVVTAAGRNIWSLAQPLILTACSGDVTHNPQTLTFPKTFLAPDFNIAMDHSGVTELTIPIRLIVLPVGTTTSSPVTRPVPCEATLYFSETLVA